MVLNLNYVKKKISQFPIFLILFVVFYLVSNFVYLIWYIANPEGFWGVIYFIELLFVSILIVFAILFILFLLLIIFNLIYKIIKGKSSFKDFFIILGTIMVIVIFTVTNFIEVHSIPLYFSKKLSDKYSYLQKTEEFINKGNIAEAFEYAKNSYDKVKERKEPSNFLFMAKLYSQTNFDKKQKLLNEYAALINYAYCLKTNHKSIDNSELKFTEALKLAESDLLEYEYKNLAIYPILSLAEIHLTKGNYFEAEKYFDELYHLNKNLENEDIYYLINCNLLFADYALRIGDVNQAMKLQSENLIYYEKTDLSKTSTNYLQLLLLNANSELYFENYEKVAELLIKSYPIAKKRQDKAIYNDFLILKGNYCLSAGLNNRGNELVLERNWWTKIKESFSDKTDLNAEILKEAEKCFLEIVQKTKENNGGEGFEYLQSLNRLGNYYSHVGKNELAYKSYKEAISILKPYKDKNKELFYDLSLNAVFSNIENPSNQSIIKEIESYQFEKIFDNFLFLSEDEKVSFAINLEKKFNIINSFHTLIGSKESAERLYDNVLALKNVALFSNQNIRSYLNNASPEIKSKYQNLLLEKEQQAYSNSKEIKLSLNKKQRDLIEEINKQEAFKIFNPNSINWNNVRDYLEHDEVAIEIINVPENLNGNNDKGYYALIINKLDESPKIVSLFKESELLKLLNQNGKTKERIEKTYQNGSTDLYQLVWKKIEDETVNKKNIFLSVTGTLHTVSFPTLLNGRNINFTYLSSTKDIAKIKNQISNKDNITIFGDIDYGIFNETKASKQRSVNTHFHLLPYSKDETHQINDEFVKLNLKEISLFTKKNASERNFRNITGTKTNIIHVASHGFYNKHGKNNFDSNIYENLFLNTGLVFANANIPISDKKNDGIMNSFEISQMDLSAVDLVVLSACETGLGDIKGSEGVFGLQRAFKLAGVKSMIVSLWQVPDKSTSELMVFFYKNYLNGYSKKESLKLAQEEISKKYNSPFYWGGFVLIE